MDAYTLKKKIKKAVGSNETLLTVMVDEEHGAYNVIVRLNLFDIGKNEYIKVESFLDLRIAKEFAETIQRYCESQDFENVEVNDEIDSYCD